RAGAVLRLALERAGTGGAGARSAGEDRLQRAGPVVRRPSAAVRARGPGLRDARRAAHGRVLELLGEARRNARAGAPPRLADRVLHAPRAPGAAAAAVGGGGVERGGALAHRHGDGWVRGGLLRDAVAPYGACLCKAGECPR